MQGSHTAPHARVLGTDCYCGDPKSAVSHVLERIRQRGGGYACFCNVHVLVTALHEPRLQESLSGAWAVFPDGAPVAWLQRRTGHARARRIAGPDLMPRIIEAGQGLGLRHYLLGSTDDVLRQLRECILVRVPGSIIAGASAPAIPSPTARCETIVARIREAEPDVVWCAFGAPKQELWMRANHAELAPALLLGVGAAFEFVAGTKPRAPAYLQRAGLEWAHRLASEPRRLGGRYLRTNVEFLVRSGRELARRRHY